jgi:hypothetical protein
LCSCEPTTSATTSRSTTSSSNASRTPPDSALTAAPSLDYKPCRTPQSRGAYCCWIGKDRHFLARGPDDAPGGPTFLAALDQFRKLLAREAHKGTDDYLVSSLLNQYRAHLTATRKSGVPGVFEVMARGFAEEFGAKRVCELRPYDFDQWLERQTQWNPTSKATRWRSSSARCRGR